MPLLGTVGALAIVGVAALFVDYLGDDRARNMARVVFAVVAIRSLGITLSGFASAASDAWALVL